MHASGTSLLGGLLHRLGLHLPGEQINAEAHKPVGCLEWSAVVDLQERLLIDLERWWPSHQGCLPMPEGWLSHSATLAARKQLFRLLHQQVTLQQSPWFIKDPRISRLLPLWIELAAELSIPLRLILAVRDPAEVVSSLLHRDADITGMDLARAQQLWWLHNLEVIHAAKEAVPFSVVDFGRWFSQPEAQLEQLFALIPDLKPSEDQRCQALALIRPELRRINATAVSLHWRVRRLHRQLLDHGRRRWPAAEPPRSLQQAAAKPPASLALAADPASWLQWYGIWKHYPARSCAGPIALTADVLINSCGFSFNDWQPHLWLQKVPCPEMGHRAIQADADQPHQIRLGSANGNWPEGPVEGKALERIALNFELPPPERADHWLTHLRGQHAIWDPDPARVCLLRALELPAYWLDPDNVVNGWLQQSGAVDPGVWASLLGLASPSADHVLVLGPAGPEWDRALAEDARQIGRFSASIDYLPGWPELISKTPATGLAKAGWLSNAAAASSQLVWMQPADQHEPALNALSALAPPPMFMEEPLTPAELIAQQTGKNIFALAEDRASPASEVLYSWEVSHSPQAAVVVSLFNYGACILTALESVAAQSQQNLELIVIDDASSDNGSMVVKAWMADLVAAEAHPFVRLVLLRHCSNAGLAAARNTGFAAAKAPWCFVLDADNAIFPEAVRACFALANKGSDDLAVVHPLLAVEVEPGRPDDQRSLVSTAAWQRERLCRGNVVDAMAMVRRSAWQSVGGYTHIEGGWEDYDFWCKLIDAGFYGLQCPQVLGVYRSHSESMSHTATNSSWRALSRTLQARHPWLQLPLAQP